MWEVGLGKGKGILLPRGEKEKQQEKKGKLEFTLAGYKLSIYAPVIR